MKRLISAMLVLVLVVCLAAVSVSAACSHAKCAFEDNCDGTHNSVCTSCGKVVAKNIPCDKVAGACPSCGHDFGETCEHPIQNYIFSSANNGTHRAVCGLCGALPTKNNIPCDFNADGVCFTCGYAKPTQAPVCNHSTCRFESNSNGTHNSVCAACGEAVASNIPCDEMNGACPSCGYGAVEAAPVKPAATNSLLLKLLGKLFR